MVKLAAPEDGGTDNPDWNIYLDWIQISDTMREVKERGIVRKDLRWNASYIEKEAKPESIGKYEL